jgi:hypothetical protein
MMLEALLASSGCKIRHDLTLFWFDGQTGCCRNLQVCCHQWLPTTLELEMDLCVTRQVPRGKKLDFV